MDMYKVKEQSSHLRWTNGFHELHRDSDQVNMEISVTTSIIDANAPSRKFRLTFAFNAVMIRN